MLRGALVLALGVGIGLAPIAVAPAVAGPPGMPDPKAMSGIPRADPALSPDELTVRCLLGGFAEPAVGVRVSLEVRPDGGGTPITMEATADQSGRATFSGLAPHAGGTAVARATLAGAEIQSAVMPLVASAGTRVMLVAGASAASMGTMRTMRTMGTIPPTDPSAPPAVGHGGAPTGAHDIPPFGEPFPLPGRPAGTLVVGLLHVDTAAAETNPAAAIAPVADREVVLYAVDDGGAEVELARQRSDADGRVRFEGIDAMKVEGEGVPRRFVVAASFDAPSEKPTETGNETVPAPEAGEKTGGGPAAGDETPKRVRSKPFALAETAQAIVLADAHIDLSGRRPPPSPNAAPAAGPGMTPSPARLPPARRDPSLEKGRVRVIVVDRTDRPVAEQAVTIIRIDATRNREPTMGETNANGMATVEVEARDDSFYFVQVDHDDAPYRSGFFEMPPDAGVTVAVRVFPRTEDRSRIRSAVHFEVDALENDKARVLQVYEVAVEGEAAFWPRGGMKLWSANGGHGAKPLPDALRWLEEVEDAPYVKLGRPLEPGGVLELSYAYIIDHDGDVEIDWDAPFPLIGARAAVRADQDLSAGAAGPPKVVEHDETVSLVPVSRGAWRTSVCEQMRAADPEVECPASLLLGGGEHVSFTMAGLIRRPRTYWIIGGVVFGFILLIAGIAVVSAPSRGSADVLRRRRDALIEALAAEPAESPRRQALVRALDRVVRQLEALG